MSQFLLHESASGYALFEVTASDELAQGVDAVQRSVESMERFGKSVKLAAFKPFTSAANALEQINAVSESQVCRPDSPGPARMRGRCEHAYAPRAVDGSGARLGVSGTERGLFGAGGRRHAAPHAPKIAGPAASHRCRR